MTAAIEILATVVLLLVASAGHAAEICDDTRAAGTNYDALLRLIDHDCLGGEHDEDADVQAIRASLGALEDVEVDAGFRLAHVRAVVIHQLDVLSRRAADPALPAGTPHPLSEFAAEMARAREELETTGRSRRLSKAHWQIEPEEGRIGDLYRLCPDLLGTACREPKTPIEPARFGIAEDALRHAHLMRWVSRYAAQAELDRFERGISTLHEMWRQYAVEARSQTPIELAINSWRFDESRKLQGFVRPPDRQIIALHPSVAMEYVDGADEGSRFEPALMVEWIGINRWRWRGGASPRMAHPVGVSLVSTYSDRAGTRDVGHGVVLHYKHVYSLGVTRHGGDTGVFVSVDLQKLLMDKKETLEEVRRRFRVTQ